MTNVCPLRKFRFPVTAECVAPDAFQGRNHEEIEKLEVYEGNKKKTLGELFKIDEVEGEEAIVAIQGDVSKVRRIGACMTKGEIVIRGDVGPHLGEGMRGGKIIVYGDVGGWAGSMMKGGEIEIHGDVSGYLGVPCRGSREGMNGGRIVVFGNAGNEAGAHMKKGLIKIYGEAGQFAGFRMRSGTIYVQGNCQARAGASMVGGKIIIGGALESVLPTFTIDGVRKSVKIEENEMVELPLFVFLGDLAENGNGKLYVVKEKNPHLAGYERFL